MLINVYAYNKLHFSDIDECVNPGVCGQNALCQNLHGNFTCVCPQGFVGNPYNGCVDVDECEHPNQCGPNAICRNVVGGRECHCPPGYDGDPYTVGCNDMDECSRGNLCGRNAHCTNIEGSFKCSCPPGFIGDPMTECSGIFIEILIIIQLYILYIKRNKQVKTDFLVYNVMRTV